MSLKEKNITISVSDEEYTQLYALAKKSSMSLRDFVRSLAVLFTDNNDLLEKLNNPDVKKTLEEDLQKMAAQLEKQQQFVDLLLRSIYSTQLSLEGQFIKHRKEAAKELKKDMDRISYMVKSAS
jgi:predicted CopG family antitoxin